MYKEMNINERLALVKFRKGKESHLSADHDVCMRCEKKYCTFICPADVYEWNEEKCLMTIRYENCLECGACKIACDKKNIVWNYPNAGDGVKYKNG